VDPVGSPHDDERQSNMKQTGTGEGRTDANEGMPRWVKVSGIVAALIVVLLVAVMLLSGGEHGPGRHFGGLSATAPAMRDGIPAA
jgi:hypothetical protein